VASARGHRVALYDREPEIGGALRWASRVRPENALFLDYLRTEIARSDVEVHLDHEIDAEDVVAMTPDAVIVATGGIVVSPELPGARSLREVVAAGEASWPVGPRVVLVGAGLAALQFAECLAARGRQVTVLEAGEVIAPEVGLKRRTEVMDALDRLTVAVNTGVEVVRVEDGGVVVRPDSGGDRVLAADDVVVTGEVVPNLALYEAIEGRVPVAHAVGDCTGFGLIRKATEDGARAAALI
jgi:2,4-dienoyl-CoA reductase (NADPH2)